MNSKATAIAPSNIAFIKYWGTRDVERTLPYNPSLSMTLSRCVTRTTVEYIADEGEDEISYREEDGRLVPAPEGFAQGVRQHLERLRTWASVDGSFRVATENSFPTGAGLASSASGFAALTIAVVEALEREVSSPEMSVLARLSGSGSAARSVLGGYVEWPAADDDQGGHAVAIAAADHWQLKDLIAILDTEPKSISSRQGHRLATTSPYFEPRLELLPSRLDRVRSAIQEKSFEQLAPVVEEEAIDLHLIAMSSSPPIFYWLPGTLTVLATIRRLRSEGLAVCATMDAGANVHMICLPEDEERIAGELEAIPEVSTVIRDGVGKGPQTSEEHLF
jgi:diphosphomevalonate decarboxylase